MEELITNIPVGDLGIQLDFILSCEIFLSEPKYNMYKIPGYRFYHKSRKNETRGGVAVYIKDTLKVKLREDLCTFCEGEFESILPKVKQHAKAPGPLVNDCFWKCVTYRETKIKV